MHGLYIFFVVIYEIIKVVAIIHVLMDNRQPVKTMAWAMVIYFVPVAGLVLYLFFGINTRRDKLISQRSLDQLTRRSMLGFVDQNDLQVPERHKQMVELFVNDNSALPFNNNKVELFTNGYSFFLSLIADMGRARHHIHVDVYIFENDALGRLMRDVLIDKARQGVEVRVIYDDVGSWSTDNEFFEQMRDAGVEVSAFLPVRFPQFAGKVNYRNHRKLFVIDGEVGYVGGYNIATRYVKGRDGLAWRDTMVRLTGNGVYGIQSTFLIDWYFVDRTMISSRQYYPPVALPIDTKCISQMVNGSPSSPYPSIMHGYVRALIEAQRYVYIQTPYFMPTESVLVAMKTAAIGGVDVRLMVPRKGDAHVVAWASRSFLREIMDAGVKVYMYKGGFLHSKILVTDDSMATCGSTNVDFRSFENNFESNVFFYDPDTAVRFRKMFEVDITSSVLLNDLTPEQLHTSFFARLWESVTRLLAPVM
ncbi:MAG: cardiolipin synthase [Prevotella sp.]